MQFEIYCSRSNPNYKKAYKLAEKLRKLVRVKFYEKVFSSPENDICSDLVCILRNDFVVGYFVNKVPSVKDIMALIKGVLP